MKGKSTSKGSRSKSSGGSSIPKLEIDKDSSVQVRKIENGFIVSESGSSGKGNNRQYYNKEYFTTKNPVAGVITKGNGPVKFGKK